MLILAANYFHKILLLMKKHSFLMRLLLFFLLLATGSVSRLSAAESPGDSLFNAAYTDVQVLINEIDRTSQYYHYIPAVDHYLDAVADEGVTSSKEVVARRIAAQNVLKEQLAELYDRRVAARSEYEEEYTKYLTEGDFDALEALEKKYKGQVEGFDSEEADFRVEYDHKVANAAENLESLYKSLTLAVEEIKLDVLAAEQIYLKCLEAEELLLRATEAQKNSQAGRELQSAINEARAALNKDTFEVSAFVKMLEALLQYIESFTHETTGINAPVLTETRADVYTTGGTLLLRSVTKAEAARKLPAGLYLFGGKKVCLP